MGTKRGAYRAPVACTCCPGTGKVGEAVDSSHSESQSRCGGLPAKVEPFNPAFAECSEN